MRASHFRDEFGEQVPSVRARSTTSLPANAISSSIAFRAPNRKSKARLFAMAKREVASAAVCPTIAAAVRKVRSYLTSGFASFLNDMNLLPGSY
jgi:hypothetical protein